MSITIDWPNKIINVPKSYMTLVQTTPVEVRRLDIDVFRLDLKDLEDDEEGIPYLDTHSHQGPVTVGGVTLARVVEIINGYTVTFEDDQYAVNLIGANSNIADVTNVNQVSVRSANSAGLVDLAAIRLQSYEGARVYIDTLNGVPGTLYPSGTPPLPVDTFTDAYVIATERNLSRYNLRGQIALAGGDNITQTEWFGASPISAGLLLSGQNTLGATFHQIGLQGTLNGRASFDVCALGALSGFSGIARECGLNGDVTIDAANVDNLLFFACTSVIAGTAKPTVNINGSTGGVHFRDWRGGLKLTGWTGGNSGSIDCSTGSIELDSSCTNGTLKIRINNPASVEDNSGPGFNVILEALPTVAELQNGLATTIQINNQTLEIKGSSDKDLTEVFDNTPSAQDNATAVWDENL